MRRACRLTQCHRRTAQHHSKREDDPRLRERLRELAQRKMRWGYRMLHGALRLEGFVLNHKRVYRLYKEEKLDLRPKHRKRLKSQSRGPLALATAINDRWSLDFTSDKLCDGRSFRTLNVLDVFTRRCLSIETDTSLSSERVVRVLQDLVQRHGKPQMLHIDNGPEFRSQKLDQWARQVSVQLHFIDPGKPTQNSHIESFNGRFREECLNPGALWAVGSPRSKKLDNSLRSGVWATIPSAPTPASAIYRPKSGQDNSEFSPSNWHTKRGYLSPSTQKPEVLA